MTTEMHDPLNLKELLGDELTEREQSGYAVEHTLVGEVQEALVQPGTPPDRLGELYDELDKTLLRSDWPYEEPSDVDEILRSLPVVAPAASPSGELLEDRTHAAWLGRCAGCTLGKPVEGHGWNRTKLRAYLEDADAFPLSDYLPVGGPLPPDTSLHPSWTESTKGRIAGMARDDDIDYTILGLQLLEAHGAGFASADVGGEWLRLLPFAAVYTAERVAYRNLVHGMQPPATANYRNPYREWIGALIRADIFGYVSPGDPVKAARLALKDAALSHTTNGVYGEMWAAALVAAALSSPTAQEALEIALLVVPARSRLASNLVAVRGAYDSGRTWEEAMALIEERSNGYHWVHTINNAAVVAAALLWGAGDFGRTIGLAVEAGLDTDCTGATAGSVFGALHGMSSLPPHWTAPLHDTIHSAVFGFDKVRISDLAARTVRLSEQLGHA